jgi:hypothetical protein
MGTVRGNMGTVLDHVVLSIVVDWACRQSDDGPLRYIDTHAMAPLNTPVGRDFNLLDQIRGSNRTTGVPGASVYTEIFNRAWLPGAAAWYPTHFIHAARVARRRSCAVRALLFEVNDAAAVPRGYPPENRRAEIDAFLNTPQTQAVVGIPTFAGTLASAPGDFRDPACWPAPQPWGGRALVVMSDPLEYRPEPDPGGSRFGATDLTRLRDRLDASFPEQPDLCAHVLFASANLGTWGGDPTALTIHLGAAWRQRFAPEGAATWCGACFWGGFLVFVGLARRNASSLNGECARLPECFTDALQALHTSRTGTRPRWVPG